MNYYEVVYIVHPALQAGHLDDTVNQINKKIEDLKGDILFFDNWGKKKLSYLIQKQKYGTYILFQCKINGDRINEIASEFEHNTNILRHLISKIEEEDIIKEKSVNNDENLTQGKSNSDVQKDDTIGEAKEHDKTEEKSKTEENKANGDE